jgi:hypothetical protein
MMKVRCPVCDRVMKEPTEPIGLSFLFVVPAAG